MHDEIGGLASNLFFFFFFDLMMKRFSLSGGFGLYNQSHKYMFLLNTFEKNEKNILLKNKGINSCTGGNVTGSLNSLFSVVSNIACPLLLLTCEFESFDFAINLLSFTVISLIFWLQSESSSLKVVINKYGILNVHLYDCSIWECFQRNSDQSSQAGRWGVWKVL